MCLSIFSGLLWAERTSDGDRDDAVNKSDRQHDERKHDCAVSGRDFGIARNANSVEAVMQCRSKSERSENALPPETPDEQYRNDQLRDGK